jgi:Arc/MetJ family transcription regulator
MRITIDIDVNSLNRIQKITGEKKKSPAVMRALADYLNWRQRHQFVQRILAGKTDFSLSNEELEARDVYETR